MSENNLQIFPIGTVVRDGGTIVLKIKPDYRPALKQLDQFSHVIVLWWVNGHDNQKSRSMLDCYPPYAEDKHTGVFATRAEYRPNPIALTTCPILEVDEVEGIVTVANIDAYDGSPILDLKAYFPVLDRVENAKLPKWLGFFPQSMPSEGIGIME